MTSNDNLTRRRAAMIAAGYWRDQTLLDHLNRAIKRTPDKTAPVAIRSESAEEKRLAYNEVDRLSDTLAVRLAQLGIGRGDAVSFQLPNWWQFPVLHLACLKLGAISNPLMTIFRERELRFMLRLAESKVFVVPTAFRGFDYAAMAENLRGELPALRHVFVVGGNGNSDFAKLLAPEENRDATTLLCERQLSPDDVIQLLYTSGTTGEPKGVMHTSNTMLSNLVPFAERLHLDADDVIHMPSPMAHQLGFMYGLSCQ
jgi:cyclohexanecarboxylate-CoA ligase